MSDVSRVCAWCGGELGTALVEDAAGNFITHGICSACSVMFVDGAGQAFPDFVDRLTVPVVLLGADGVVLHANGRALRILGQTLPAVRGKRLGEVLQCVHARRGCGSGGPCGACAILAAVRETHRTGNNMRDVSAKLDIGSENGGKILRLRVSTEKAGELVLLRIEDLREKRAEGPGPQARP